MLGARRDAKATSLWSTTRMRTRTRVPDWTDASDHDPGPTLVELFAFLADALAGAEPRRRRARWIVALAGLSAAVAVGAWWRTRSGDDDEPS